MQRDFLDRRFCCCGYCLNLKSVGVKILFRVSPNAKSTSVTGMEDNGTIRLRLAAPPNDGKANAELVRWLAETLGVKSRQVEILSGHASRSKIVAVTGLEKAEVLRMILPEKPD